MVFLEVYLTGVVLMKRERRFVEALWQDYYVFADVVSSHGIHGPHHIPA